jgi:hypothetical protein
MEIKEENHNTTELSELKKKGEQFDWYLSFYRILFGNFIFRLLYFTVTTGVSWINFTACILVYILIEILTHLSINKLNSNYIKIQIGFIILASIISLAFEYGALFSLMLLAYLPVSFGLKKYFPNFIEAYSEIIKTEQLENTQSEVKKIVSLKGNKRKFLEKYLGLSDYIVYYEHFNSKLSIILQSETTTLAIEAEEEIENYMFKRVNFFMQTINNNLPFQALNYLYYVNLENIFDFLIKGNLLFKEKKLTSLQYFLWRFQPLLKKRFYNAEILLPEKNILPDYKKNIYTLKWSQPLFQHVLLEKIKLKFSKIVAFEGNNEHFESVTFTIKDEKFGKIEIEKHKNRSIIKTKLFELKINKSNNNFELIKTWDGDYIHEAVRYIAK